MKILQTHSILNITVAIPVSEEQKFLSFQEDEIPVCPEGKALVDLWILLPHSKKFIRYIQRGDRVLPSNIETIRRHTEKRFFALSEDFSTPTPKDTKPAASASAMNFELGSESSVFLRQEISKDLVQIFKNISEESPLKITIEGSGIEKISSQLINTIAPEINNIREHLKKIPNYVGLMNDSAAISTLAVYFAVCTGQNSRIVFRDLAYACLLMDVSLSTLNKEEWALYYTNPNALPADIQETVKVHPQKSYELIEKRFKNAPPIVAELIRGHHELFNGQGYPQKIRSELLPQLVRVLALAVDVFEKMKKSYLQNENLTLEEAFELVGFPQTEAHLRRHSPELCRHVRESMQSPAMDA